MIRRPPRSTLDRSSVASDVYKRQKVGRLIFSGGDVVNVQVEGYSVLVAQPMGDELFLSLIHISEPTRPY